MAALLYAAIYVIALLPGLPLGVALFGRRHAAGWISGAVLGYAVTSLAVWVPIKLGLGAWAALSLGWLLAAGLATYGAKQITGPVVTLPEWTRRDTKALASVLLLTLVIALPPLARAGASDAAGHRYYRAYFTADFVWHTALTSELSKLASPPRNPYLANRPIHYYWTYFLLPAAATGAAGGEHVQTFLKVNASGTALLFVSAIFLFAWTALPRAWPVAAGVGMAIVASSAEGAFAFWRFWQRGTPLGEVRNLNIDALANWWPPRGLRIDGLQRCFWWVPQHSMAYALGLVALAIVNAAGSGAPMAAIVLAGVALGGATLMNPFVGGIFSLVWGLAVAIDALRSGQFLPRLMRHAVAAVPVGLAIGWCAGNQMIEGAGSALQFGWLGDARNAPIANLMLSLGPAIVAALVGLLVSILPPKGGSHEIRTESRSHAIAPDSGPIQLESRSFRLQAEVSAILLAIISLLLMHFVRLDVDTSWVGFRAGQMFLVAVPVLIAGGLAATGAWRRIALVTAVLAVLAGAPTTIIDAYNAQDITNFAESAIGPWTVTVTRDEQEGLDWIRRTTPPAAIVQMEPIVRGRTTWSLIPSFAQRRMAAGEPISLLGGTDGKSEYADKSARVKTMYVTQNAAEAWNLARALRIEYVWVDQVERKAYPAGVAKFDTSPQLFEPAFKNAEVAIYRVR